MGRVGEVNGELASRGDTIACNSLCLDDQRQVGHQFASPAKVSGRGYALQISMRAAQVLFGCPEQCRSTVKMTLALTTAPDLDALQNLRLQRRSKALGDFEFVVARGLLEFSKRTDAKRVIKLQYLVGPQTRNGHQFQKPSRQLLAHGFQGGMRPGLMQSGDDAGDRVAYSRDLAQTVLADQPIQRNG
jgi:hypothetical protein